MYEPDPHITAAARGDSAALTDLLEQCEPAQRRWLTHSIPRRWRAVISEDDVLQQAYVDAVRGVSGFRGESLASFNCWLETLVKRNLFDAIRMLETDKRGGDRVRVQPGGTQDSYIELFEILAGTLTTPSGCAARDEAHDGLRRSLSALPQTYRQVVDLYDLQGRPIDEVAAAVDRSPGATYMIRARAHRLLAQMLGTATGYVSDCA